MPRSASPLGLIAKWLGAPLGCAALGYFVVAPRLGHGSPPASKPKPTQQVAERIQTPAEEKPVQELVTKPAKPSPKPQEEATSTDSGEKPATTVVDPSEKPVLEVTTESVRPHVEPPPVRKKPRHRKPKVAPAQTGLDPASTGDPASTAAPASTGDSPAPKGGDEPPTTP